MSSTYQALQSLLYSGQGVGVLFHASIKVVEVNAELHAAILLPYQYHHIAPCTLARPDSARLQHLPQVVPNLLNQQWENLPKLFFKGVPSVTFIVYLVEWVQPNSVGSNENMSWYLARSWCTVSASSRGQESNPLKSSSSNNFSCLCLTVNLGVWGYWGSSPSSCNEPPWVVWAPEVLPLPWPLGFILEGLWVSCTVPYHHDCLFTSLPQLHVCVLYGEVLWQRTIFGL